MDQSKYDSGVFDVLVVGAGPAGASAAHVLAAAGLRTALLDRAAFPRPKLCGGLLTTKTLRALRSVFALDVPELEAQDAIIGKTADFSLYHRARHLHSGSAAAPFHFVSRLRFDQFLVQRAVQAGATLLQARAMNCNPARGTVATEDGRTLRARFLIGADGANSRMRRSLEPDKRRWRRDLADALEIRIPRTRIPDQTPLGLRTLQKPLLHLGFNKAGYGWVFPNPDALIIGMCGLREERPLREHLRDYLRTLGIPDQAVPAFKGHPLPYGNWLPRCAKGPLLLAGDAAGLVEPTLGEGIFYALMSGKYAALAILDEVHGRGPAAQHYQQRLDRNILPELNASNRLRKILLNAVNLLGYAPISLFLRLGGDKLAEMVQGERSYSLLRKKTWEWD